MADDNARSVYDSVLQTLIADWRRKAGSLAGTRNDDDESAALAHGIEYCAGQLEGLLKLARGES